jgi:hypothetical protein
MYTITRPVSPVSPLSPAQCLALHHQAHTQGPVVQFVSDGFGPATTHPTRPRRAGSIPAVRRLAELLLTMSALFGAGLVLGVADAGAAPDPRPRPSVPAVTVPTAKDLTIDRDAVRTPAVNLPRSTPERPDPVVPIDVTDPTDPDRFRVDPEALEPVRPNLDGVVDDAPPEPADADVDADVAVDVDAAAEDPTVAEPIAVAEPATVPEPATAAEPDTAGPPTDSTADRDVAVGTGHDVPAGSLAMTGTSAVLALLGAGVLLAGVALALTARSARRRAAVTA